MKIKRMSFEITPRGHAALLVTLCITAFVGMVATHMLAAETNEAGEKGAAKMKEATEKYNLAVTEMEAGRAKQAEDMLKAALALHPEFAEARNTLGAIYLKGNNLESAEKEFREAVRIQPKYALAYNNLGAVLLKKGSKEDALGAFEKAARLDPKSGGAYYNIGLILQANGKIKLATRYFLQALSANPRNTDALWRIGDIYRKASMKKEAEAIYTQLVKVTNHDPKAVVALSQLYAAQDMLTAAAEVIDDAKRAGVSSDDIDMERARLLLLGRHPAAEEEFRAIVKKHPESAQAYAGIAAALLDRPKGDKDEALELAKKGVELSKEQDARCLYVLGQAKKATGDVAGAQLAYLMAEKLDPNDVAVQINLGVIAVEAKQYEKAAGYFEKAVELAPDNLDAKYNLARALISRKSSYERGVRLLGDVAVQAPSGKRTAIEAATLLKNLADRAKGGAK